MVARTGQQDDPRMTWMEGGCAGVLWSLALARIWLGRHHCIDVRTAAECDFIPVAQFPLRRHRQKALHGSGVSSHVNGTEQHIHTRELRMLGEMDSFTALVAGVQTQREDLKSSVRVPNSTVLIYDNFSVNIRVVSEHPAKDFTSGVGSPMR